MMIYKYMTMVRFDTASQGTGYHIKLAIPILLAKGNMAKDIDEPESLCATLGWFCRRYLPTTEEDSGTPDDGLTHA